MLDGIFIFISLLDMMCFNNVVWQRHDRRNVRIFP
jgi:hypothetical protein